MYGSKSTLKYLVSYDGNDDIKPLCIKLTQMSGYVKCFNDVNKNMFFISQINDLMEEYDGIWDIERG